MGVERRTCDVVHVGCLVLLMCEVHALVFSSILQSLWPRLQARRRGSWQCLLYSTKGLCILLQATHRHKYVAAAACSTLYVVFTQGSCHVLQAVLQQFVASVASSMAGFVLFVACRAVRSLWLRPRAQWRDLWCVVLISFICCRPCRLSKVCDCGRKFDGLFF